MGVGGQHHSPAALSSAKTRYPLYRRLGRPQGRSGRVRKISPPPGFDPRTVQPVASRYTDWAIAAHLYNKKCSFFLNPETQKTKYIFAISTFARLAVSFYNSITFNLQTIGLLSLVLAVAGPEFSKKFHGGFEGKSQPEQP